MKDSCFLFSLLPLPSIEYPTHQGILHKRRVEKAAGVKAPPIQTHLCSEEVLHHCRVNSGCPFPTVLPTWEGSQRLGSAGNLSIMQQSSDYCFQDRQHRGMKKALSCQALFFPLSSMALTTDVSTQIILAGSDCNRSSEFHLLEALTLPSCRS